MAIMRYSENIHPKGALKVAFGRDVSKIPEDVVEVRCFIGSSGRLYVIPVEDAETANPFLRELESYGISEISFENSK